MLNIFSGSGLDIFFAIVTWAIPAFLSIIVPIIIIVVIIKAFNKSGNNMQNNAGSKSNEVSSEKKEELKNWYKKLEEELKDVNQNDAHNQTEKEPARCANCGAVWTFGTKKCEYCGAKTRSK